MGILAQRLNNSKSAQSSSGINDRICAYQNSLVAPIERAFGNGSISRAQYQAQYASAAQAVREYTRSLEGK